MQGQQAHQFASPEQDQKPKQMIGNEDEYVYTQGNQFNMNVKNGSPGKRAADMDNSMMTNQTPIRGQGGLIDENKSQMQHVQMEYQQDKDYSQINISTNHNGGLNKQAN